MKELLQQCHGTYTDVSYFHGGGIEFKNGNEVRHISVKTGHPPIPLILAALRTSGKSHVTYIVESPDSIADVAWLRALAENCDQDPSPKETYEPRALRI